MNYSAISHTFSNGITVVNTTPHPINFINPEGEVVTVATSVKEGERTGYAVVNAKPVEYEFAPHVVDTRFEPTKEGEDIIQGIKEQFEAKDKEGNLMIIGSLVAANAYPDIKGMSPAPGFERVPPDQKRMSCEKFTQGEAKSGSTLSRDTSLSNEIGELNERIYKGYYDCAQQGYDLDYPMSSNPNVTARQELEYCYKALKSIQDKVKEIELSRDNVQHEKVENIYHVQASKHYEEGSYENYREWYDDRHFYFSDEEDAKTLVMLRPQSLLHTNYNSYGSASEWNFSEPEPITINDQQVMDYLKEYENVVNMTQAQAEFCKALETQGTDYHKILKKYNVKSLSDYSDTRLRVVTRLLHQLGDDALKFTNPGFSDYALDAVTSLVSKKADVSWVESWMSDKRICSIQRCLNDPELSEQISDIVMNKKRCSDNDIDLVVKLSKAGADIDLIDMIITMPQRYEIGKDVLNSLKIETPSRTLKSILSEKEYRKEGNDYELRKAIKEATKDFIYNKHGVTDSQSVNNMEEIFSELIKRTELTQYYDSSYEQLIYLDACLTAIEDCDTDKMADRLKTVMQTHIDSSGYPRHDRMIFGEKEAMTVAENLKNGTPTSVYKNLAKEFPKEWQHPTVEQINEAAEKWLAEHSLDKTVQKENVTHRENKYTGYTPPSLEKMIENANDASPSTEVKENEQFRTPVTSINEQSDDTR